MMNGKRTLSINRMTSNSRHQANDIYLKLESRLRDQVISMISALFSSAMFLNAIFDAINSMMSLISDGSFGMECVFLSFIGLNDRSDVFVA